MAQFGHFQPGEVHFEDLEQPLEVFLLARDVPVRPVPNQLVLLVFIQSQLLFEVQTSVSPPLFDRDEVDRLEIIRLLERLHRGVPTLDQIFVNAVAFRVDELLYRELELLQVPIVNVRAWSSHHLVCGPP